MKKRGMSPSQARDLRLKRGLKESKLQRYRVKKGLSQAELSQISGVTVRAIQTYEQRKKLVDSARLETICNLAYSLDVKIPDILENKKLIEKFNSVK